VGQYGTIIQADETPFEFTPGRGSGIAFDLGTTTLVGQLLDLETGQILAVERSMNPQGKMGADLVTRLETALRYGTAESTTLIRDRLGQMAGRMMEGREPSLERMVIVGNTAMHHFFCGLDITPLSFYPFQSPHLTMVNFTARDLGWSSLQCDQITFYPPIGSFVGSDILAGVLAAGMHRRKEHSILIDLGTNGEIVVGNREGLWCASTAAGPAFEGATISCGMQATTGAIASVRPEGKGWNCRVIGDGRPAGICGSGLIDAIAVWVAQGKLGEFGEILSDAPDLLLDDPVRITRRDIQEFLLAKAALATGIEILLRRASLSPEKIVHVFIAGGFGTFINLDHVRKTGMLDFPVSRMIQLGNTALMGAKMFLFEKTALALSIRDSIGHVSLESEADFQDLFVRHLTLAPSSL
jgi:uncharacterized 2Fe-2S/4Fe-4S cluster protein (DUF4445 family)